MQPDKQQITGPYVLKLEQIQKNAAISGLEPGQVVRIVTTEPVGDNALTVYYKTADGKLLERMLFRTDEAKLSLAEAGRPCDLPPVDVPIRSGSPGSRLLDGYVG